MGKWPSLIAHHHTRRTCAACVRHDHPSARLRASPERWIFVVGGADAGATGRYLRAGYRVLCIEADPLQAARLARRFVGRACTVLNVTVATAEGAVPFLVGSPRATGCSNSTQEVWVRARTLASIFRQFGVPYLLTVNTTAANRHVILSLTRASAPKFVAFQAADSGLECLLHLHRIGFRHFNLSADLRTSGAAAQMGAPQSPPRARQQSFRNWLRSQPGLRALTPVRRCTAESLFSRVGADKRQPATAAPPAQMAYGWRDIAQVLHDVARLSRRACTGFRIGLIAARGRAAPRAAAAGTRLPRAAR